MVLLTLIARVRDGLILATSIEGADDPEHNLVRYTSQAKMLFRKLSAPNTPNVQSISSGPYFFQWVHTHYSIKGPICALCLCDANFPRKVERFRECLPEGGLIEVTLGFQSAFAYLDDVASEFLNQNGNQVESTIRPYHFLEFDTYIQQAKRKYTDKSRFAMTAVNNELQDVTRIMVSNIEDVIHRGEALNILESRAADLSHLSKKYREDAKQLNRRSAVFKIFVGMGVAGFLFLLIRFFLF